MLRAAHRVSPVSLSVGGAASIHGGVALTANDLVALSASQKMNIPFEQQGQADPDAESPQFRHPDLVGPSHLLSFDHTHTEGQAEIQSQLASLPQAPLPTTSWPAFQARTGFSPADAQIAASRTHVVVTTNDTIAVYNKAGQLLQAIYPWDFFGGLNLQQQFGIDKYYDVRAMFDSYRNRFWVGALAENLAHESDAERRSKFVVAVSATENPQDGWYLYWWNAVVNDGVPNDPVYKPGDGGDFPSLGIDSTAIYQTNMVCKSRLPGEPGYDPANPHCDYRYWHVIFFPASQLANNLDANGWQYWDLANPDGSPAGMIQPVVHHGTSSHTYFVSRFYGGSNNTLLIWGLTNPLQPDQHMDRVEVTVTPFNWPQIAPQSGSSMSIEMRNLGTDVLKAVYRDNILYLTANDGRDWFNDGQILSSIRLVRLFVGSYPSIPTDPTSGFIDRVFGSANAFDDPPNAHIYYDWPAVEVNRFGDMAIVYARSGSTIDPEARFSAYYASEPDIRPSRLLKAGDAPYALNYPGYHPDAWRWGDVAGASVDPYDDTGIWITQQYADTHSVGDPINNSAVWVGKVFGSAHPDLAVSNIAFSCATSPCVVHPGDRVEINVTIANQGDGSAPSSQVGVYLSVNSFITMGDTLIATLNTLMMNSGASRIFTASATVPTNMALGQYYVGTIIDPSFQLAEYSKGNNRLTAAQRLQIHSFVWLPLTIR